MAQQTIGIGASANDGTGDPIRTAFNKCNANFTELYAGLTGLLDFKGSTDCSANPNYPAALKGDFYLVSVAGKIGGASGVVVEVGDSYFATADNAGGTQAAVGTSWTVIQGNTTGGSGSVASLDDIGDVNAPTPGNGEVLTWDSTPGEWISQALPGAGSFVLDDATDVDTTGVGDGDVLTFDSGSGDWIAAAPSGGALVLISQLTPTGTGTASFTSIASTWRDLIVMVRGRGATAANNVNVDLVLNTDTTDANYERIRVGTVNGGSTVTGSSASDNVVGTLPAASATANVAGEIEIIIADYKGTTFHKEFRSGYGGRMGTTLSAFAAGIFAGRWANTAAVTQVDIILAAGNFEAGSVVSLYGRA